MKSNHLFLVAISAGVLSAAVSASANAAASPAQTKCYGVVKAGKNSCASATGVHSCAGQSKVDNDPGDWVNLSAAECAKDGGKTTPPAPAKI
jgi:uncharacterized membrane protein